MTTYLWVKLVHIVSATILFGTGLGTAYFMLQAWLSGAAEALRHTSRHVVIADWVFTAPAVVVQLLTGLWLADRLDIGLASPWLRYVLGLYLFVGACWLPVVWIQIRISRILQGGGGLDDCRRLMLAWVLLGIPAFLSVLLLFYLMVSKSGMYVGR